MQELNLLKQELQKLEIELEEESYITDGYKIQVNGSFGKFGNKYSALYSPMLVTQTTVTGQLILLMLIEKLELLNFKVISGNTDGFVTIVPTERKAEFDNVISLWENYLGFETEETIYKSMHQRDVNSFIIVKENGELKEKGVYSERGSALNSRLSKNPDARICVEAVEAFLLTGKPLADTITECKDFRRFISVKKVEGGAQKAGQFLGKTVRWYYAKGETGTINYVTTGNTVGKTEGAKPCMDLPDEFPLDIDYNWYISEASAMLFDLGFYKKAGNGDLFK